MQERFFSDKLIAKILDEKVNLLRLINISLEECDQSGYISESQILSYIEKYKQITMRMEKKSELNEEGLTALMIAAGEGYDIAVKNELELFGGDVNAKGKRNLTALMMAADKGHIKIVKILLKHGADVNAVNDDNHSALMIASRKGYIEIVRSLMRAGADPNIRAKSGVTASILADWNGHQNIVKYISNYGKYKKKLIKHREGVKTS